MTDTNLSSEARLREALAEHWLFEMNCDHGNRCDRASCACGWLGDWKDSVGEAAMNWADHALSAIKSHPTSDSPLREQLAGLRDKWREGAYELGESALVSDGPRQAVKTLHRCADEIDVLLLAYPVGVEPPSLPARGRDNHGDRTRELVAKFSDLAVELEKHSNDHIHDEIPDNLGAAVEGVCADRISEILKPYRVPAPQPMQLDGERERFEAWWREWSTGDESIILDQFTLTQQALVVQCLKQCWFAAYPAPPQPEGERVRAARERELGCQVALEVGLEAAAKLLDSISLRLRESTPPEIVGSLNARQYAKAIRALAATPTPATPLDTELKAGRGIGRAVAIAGIYHELATKYGIESKLVADIVVDYEGLLYELTNIEEEAAPAGKPEGSEQE